MYLYTGFKSAEPEPEIFTRKGDRIKKKLNPELNLELNRRHLIDKAPDKVGRTVGADGPAALPSLGFWNHDEGAGALKARL